MYNFLRSYAPWVYINSLFKCENYGLFEKEGVNWYGLINDIQLKSPQSSPNCDYEIQRHYL